jgi:carbonic anhydrase/acetyltransferase-like protein (isoleucine patch superfamily)
LILSHLGKQPHIDPTATVASTATVCGDVTLGPGCRVLHGATVVAEAGRIALGRHCIVMENAVVRATGRHDCLIGDHCLIGPSAHVVGCTIEDEVFIATGAAVFHAARIGRGSEVRVHAIVHLRTVLPGGTVVPIGWVAVGDPAEILPPDQHDRIWAIQRPLDFPMTAYGLPRGEGLMREIARTLSEALATHGDDEPV